MPRLVIRDQAALLIGEDAALALEAEHHLVLGVLQVLLVDVGFVAAGGGERPLLPQVGELPPGEPRRPPRDRPEVCLGRLAAVAGGGLPDLPPPPRLRAVPHAL